MSRENCAYQGFAPAIRIAGGKPGAAERSLSVPGQRGREFLLRIPEKYPDAPKGGEDPRPGGRLKLNRSNENLTAVPGFTILTVQP
jgi:hypothetical protein